MTDLLGLLSGIHNAVIHHGELRLTITDLGDMHGAVDLHTGAIHLSPGLAFPEMLHALADAVAVLAPPVSEDLPAALAVGGEVASAVVPQPRHLTLVPDPTEYSEKPGRTALTSDML